MTKNIKYLHALNKAKHARDRGLPGKLMFRPKEFFVGFFNNKIYYPLTRHPRKMICKTICGDNFVVWLPAGLDIYLLGMKSHDAELRLSRFILNTVREGAFIDIGAHFGFYTLLASNLLMETGHVHSVEPSQKTFEVLKENAADRTNVTLHNNVVSNQISMVFREYDVSHSEYNKIVGRDGQTTEQFDKINYSEYAIDCLTLSELGSRISDDHIFIKLDVEGAEYEALLGGHSFLSNASPTIAMEYHIGTSETDEGCKKGAQFLFNLKYKAYVIGDKGDLNAIKEPIDNFLKNLGRDVDNLIFKK